jgi:hypothetical protein
MISACVPTWQWIAPHVIDSERTLFSRMLPRVIMVPTITASMAA